MDYCTNTHWISLYFSFSLFPLPCHTQNPFFTIKNQATIQSVFYTEKKKRPPRVHDLWLKGNFVNDNFVSFQQSKVENWSFFIIIMFILLVMSNAETSLKEPNCYSIKASLFSLVAANSNYLSYMCLLNYGGYPRGWRPIYGGLVKINLQE